MGKFLWKTSLLVLLLFFGVILGMQYANKNMKEMRGYDDPKMYEAFAVEKESEGEINATVLGKEISTADIEEKKEEMEEWKAYNAISSAGKGISNACTGIFQGLAKLISDE